MGRLGLCAVTTNAPQKKYMFVFLRGATYFGHTHCAAGLVDKAILQRCVLTLLNLRTATVLTLLNLRTVTASTHPA